MQIKSLSLTFIKPLKCYILIYYKFEKNTYFVPQVICVCVVIMLCMCVCYLHMTKVKCKYVIGYKTVMISWTKLEGCVQTTLWEWQNVGVWGVEGIGRDLITKISRKFYYYCNSGLDRLLCGWFDCKRKRDNSIKKAFLWTFLIPESKDMKMQHSSSNSLAIGSNTSQFLTKNNTRVVSQRGGFAILPCSVTMSTPATVSKYLILIFCFSFCLPYC